MLTFLKSFLVAVFTGLFVAITLISSGATLADQGAALDQGSAPDLTTALGVYTAACIACHGADGRGSPPERVGFDLPLPDFSECTFATREPDADWFAITHQGGPARGFADNMPAFGEALTAEQITMAIDHVHTFCDEPAWPRGDLNFPRAIITEKAFPEDELLLTTKINAEGDGYFEHDVLYERRIGAVNQFEFKAPIKALENDPDGGWNGGIGDIELGVKRVLAHSKDAGYIFSVTGAVLLPVGDSERGLGKGTVVFEPFLTAGFALPSDSFVQLQGGVELSVDTDTAAHEAFYRAVVGKTFTQGRFGRSWTPMLEILAGSEFAEEGAEHQLDLLPEMQVTLNTRQNIMANFGVRFPVTEAAHRDTQILFYLLWDWYDGGFLEGW